MRLPWTIWRYTLLEMWRLLLLTAGVLVTVISFAVTVRLVAEGRLGSLESLWYMVLAMPPMLQYALPFAAGFGATLTYHRMSQDNELVACWGGGVSHQKVLAPALLTGVVLAVVIGILNGTVIPRFLRSMERIAVEDAPRFVYNTLSAGRPLELKDMQIHADSVRKLGEDPENGVSERLLLNGVMALKVDPLGNPIYEAFAQQALVEFQPAPGDDTGASRGNTMVLMTLRKASVTQANGSSGVQDESTIVWNVPGLFDDNPKYLTNAELRALPSNPDSLSFVDVRRRDLAVHLAERRSTAVIDESLRKHGSVDLTDEAGRRFTVRGRALKVDPAIDRWEILPGPSGVVEVDVTGAGGRGVAEGRRFQAHVAAFRSDIGKDRLTRQLRLRLVMEDVLGRSGGGSTPGQAGGGERQELSYNGLAPAVNPLAELSGLKSAELLRVVDSQPVGKDPYVRVPAKDLKDRIQTLMRDVVAKKQERLANALACLVMVLTGAITAMRLGSSLPLAVYLWSFFPALFSVITIAAGQQVTRQMGMGGLSVLWAGVVLLAAYAVGAFMVVRKH